MQQPPFLRIPQFHQAVVGRRNEAAAVGGPKRCADSACRRVRAVSLKGGNLLSVFDPPYSDRPVPLKNGQPRAVRRPGDAVNVTRGRKPFETAQHFSARCVPDMHGSAFLKGDAAAHRRPDRPAQPQALVPVELEHGFARRGIHDARGGKRLDIDAAAVRGNGRGINRLSVGEPDRLFAGQRVPDDRRLCRLREDVAAVRRQVTHQPHRVAVAGYLQQGGGRGRILCAERLRKERKQNGRRQRIDAESLFCPHAAPPQDTTCRGRADQKSILTSSSLSAFMLRMATSTASCLAISRKALDAGACGS